MTCIHTGADVYLEAYGATYRCDIHLIAGAIVLRLNNEPDRVRMRDSHTYSLHGQGAADNWFDKGEMFGTLICAPGNFVIPSAHRGRWSGHVL